MVNVKNGDFVRMEYVGRVASTGMIFDTTDEAIAKKAGIYQQSSLYGPKLAIYGSNMIMLGIEEAIQKAPLGKTEEFEIQPEKAFGGKEKSLVRMMPMKEFARQNVQPVPGMVMTLDNMMATVKSVSSGRVVVDFNHPLAGEPVIYSLKIVEVITDNQKKVEAMLSSVGVKGTVTAKGKELVVALDKSLSKDKSDAAKSAILAVVPGTTFV